MEFWGTLQRHPVLLTGIAALSLVLLRAAVLQVHRPDHRAWSRAFGVVLGLVSLAVVARVTLRGLPVPDGFGRRINLVPFRELARTPVAGEYGDAITQLSGNVLLFVPLGVALALALPRPRLRAVLVLAAGLSVSIETAQYVLATGRVCEVTDVLLNVVGAVAGYSALAGQPLAALRRAATPPPAAATSATG